MKKSTKIKKRQLLLTFLPKIAWNLQKIKHIDVFIIFLHVLMFLVFLFNFFTWNDCYLISDFGMRSSTNGKYKKEQKMEIV